MFIEDDPKIKLMFDAIGHKRSCICVGCFLSWLQHQEAGEWVRKQLRLYADIEKAQNEVDELRRQGKLPPDERVYGHAA